MKNRKTVTISKSDHVRIQALKLTSNLVEITCELWNRSTEEWGHHRSEFMTREEVQAAAFLFGITEEEMKAVGEKDHA